MLTGEPADVHDTLLCAVVLYAEFTRERAALIGDPPPIPFFFLLSSFFFFFFFFFFLLYLSIYLQY